eukprot:Rhum_TRINITY_DN312_c0_g1::Rhum_TRINITY_DN312_c0_g1_i1::g.1087::m.1087
MRGTEQCASAESGSEGSPTPAADRVPLRAPSNRLDWKRAKWSVFAEVMEERASAALRKNRIATATVNLFRKCLRAAVAAAVPTVRRLTCKMRKRIRRKEWLKNKKLKSAKGPPPESSEEDAGPEAGDAALAHAAPKVAGAPDLVEKTSERYAMAALRLPNVEGRPRFATTAADKAEVLADLFTAAGATASSAAQAPELPADTGEADAPISVAEVEEALSRQPEGHKASGPGGVDDPPMKHLGRHSVLLLRKAFQQVFDEGVWPRDWAMAWVVPVLKKEKDASLPDSYYPVYLTSLVGKVCERVVGARLKRATQGNLTDTEAGFRSGRGTANHFAARQRLALHTERGLYTAMLCVDVSAALDRVDHRHLLARLAGMGVQGQLLRVVRKFLFDRMVRVRVDTVLSKTRHLTSGVPHGTVLAPLLFVLFVDDLARRLEADGCDPVACAGEVALLVSAPSAEELAVRVASGLETVEGWAEELRLVLSRENMVVRARDPAGEDIQVQADTTTSASELGGLSSKLWPHRWTAALPDS